MNSGTLFKYCLSLLPRRDLLKVIIVVVIQSLLSILDLLGVALIGLLGALTVTGVQSRPPQGILADVLVSFGLEDVSLQRQAAILGAIAGVLLIAKTCFSILFTQKTFKFLSNRSASMSSLLTRKLLSQPVTEVSDRTSQETIYSLTQGVNNITLGVIGNSVSVISDISLIVVLFTGLFILDAVVAGSTFIFFSSLGFLLYKLLHNKAHKLGEAQANLNIESNEKISEMIFGYREMFSKGRRGFYAKKISVLRFELSKFQAEATFLPFIGKYVIETAVILGVLIISAAQFAFSDAADAVATLSVFLAASTRIAPAILRVQQGGINVRSALGASIPSIQLIAKLDQVEEIEIDTDKPVVDFDYTGFSASVRLKGVTFYYPGASTATIKDVSFEVNPGEFIAIVGESGAGKSTLADLILGLIQPDSGSIIISGLSPESAIKKWPGAISYVPQNSFIANASIKENLTLGFESGAIPSDMVENSLEMARLSPFINSLPLGIETVIGEVGSKISGGQRQRIGIARALCSKPRLVILDEATSALDGTTEAEIANSILALRSSVTLIVIAHRLSTIKEADRIIYLDKGEVRAVNSFENLRREVPEFELQSQRMGISIQSNNQNRGEEG